MSGEKIIHQAELSSSGVAHLTQQLNNSATEAAWQFHQENPEEEDSNDVRIGDDCVGRLEDLNESLSTKKKRTSRGKQKIDIKFMEEKSRRFTTFSKRKTGLMKKAYELAALTNAQVLLLVASETGHVYTFATKKLQSMISSDRGKTLIQTCLSSENGGSSSSGSSDGNSGGGGGGASSSNSTPSGNGTTAMEIDSKNFYGHPRDLSSDTVDVENVHFQPLQQKQQQGLAKQDSLLFLKDVSATTITTLNEDAPLEQSISFAQADTASCSSNVMNNVATCRSASSFLLPSMPPAVNSDLDLENNDAESMEQNTPVQFIFLNNPQTGQLQAMYLPPSLQQDVVDAVSKSSTVSTTASLSPKDSVSS